MEISCNIIKKNIEANICNGEMTNIDKYAQQEKQGT